MAKQIIHLLLFIALVGQNLLSPAMAMPDFLHSMSHKSALLQEAGSQQKDEVRQTVATSTLEAKTSTSPDLPQSVVQCDLACIILASGHCVTHCASMTGIFIQSSLDLIASTSSERIPNRLWSIQTADAAQVYRPPIS
ncbi:hypothetical protein FM037_02220 [Shewanella psychropiezotolerans]|uniref:Uncharacterized protein n=1 Tax=Shewanella psychropiezotolerans TaxID=2593655 RepID=A0ABX5WT45_9GAMM|nr:hypothetical protein [Shewanella psychropiezotolerans]QDO82270.1 hypothetical protein FM037_02220 [Shewanella psychropiezotolerans]